MPSWTQPKRVKADRQAPPSASPRQDDPRPAASSPSSQPLAHRRRRPQHRGMAQGASPRGRPCPSVHESGAPTHQRRREQRGPRPSRPRAQDRQPTPGPETSRMPRPTPFPKGRPNHQRWGPTELHASPIKKGRRKTHLNPHHHDQLGPLPQPRPHARPSGSCGPPSEPHTTPRAHASISAGPRRPASPRPTEPPHPDAPPPRGAPQPSELGPRTSSLKPSSTAFPPARPSASSKPTPARAPSPPAPDQQDPRQTPRSRRPRRPPPAPPTGALVASNA